MIKKIRQQFYGVKYRTVQKLIHRAGLCKPEPNPYLAEAFLLGEDAWKLPYRCDWCGARNSRVVLRSEYQDFLYRAARKTEKMKKVFG
jgi:hypothetical protein